jgi:hypothetical protein
VSKGLTLQPFIVAILINIVAKISKLCWFDDQSHQEITNQIFKILKVWCVLLIDVISNPLPTIL